MFMKNINFVFLLSAFLLLNTCNKQADEGIEIAASSEEVSDGLVTVTPQQYEQAKMQLGTLQAQDLPNIVTASGMIDVPPGQQAAVSAYAGGYVKNIQLVPGQMVRKGQRLFTLENPELLVLQQNYLETIAQLAYLKADYQRQETLADENIASQKNNLKATADYQATLARAEGLKARLQLLGINTKDLTPTTLANNMAIYAPISGYISEVNAMPGMYLQPQDVALKIINTSNLHVELEVFEKDILSIKIGQKILFRIPDTGTKTYEAEVHIIQKTLDPETRLVRVHGELNQPEGLLLPGMYVSAEILTNDSKGMSIPETALVSAGETTYLLVLKERTPQQVTFEQRMVKMGTQRDGWVQILNPEAFQTQDSILVEGAFNLIGIE
jgi:cobalt-zinc-cadmium efflux system membrane fusion protein